MMRWMKETEKGIIILFSLKTGHIKVCSKLSAGCCTLNVWKPTLWEARFSVRKKKKEKKTHQRIRCLTCYRSEREIPRRRCRLTKFTARFLPHLVNRDMVLVENDNLWANRSFHFLLTARLRFSLCVCHFSCSSFVCAFCVCVGGGGASCVSLAAFVCVIWFLVQFLPLDIMSRCCWWWWCSCFRYCCCCYFLY